MNHDTPISTQNWQELPQFTFVPGLTPRPTTPFPESLPTSQIVRIGQRYFDAGYYWEAHEAWENAWIAAGRTGVYADYLKGCIKLAACGVKCLAQNPAGATRHAKRAGQLFEGILLSTDQEKIERIKALTHLIARASELTSTLPLVTQQHRDQAISGGSPILGPMPVDLTLF